MSKVKLTEIGELVVAADKERQRILDMRDALERNKTFYEMLERMGEIVLPWAGARLFIGGCIENGAGSSFRAQAHAHNHETSALRRYICVRGVTNLTRGGGQYQLKAHGNDSHADKLYPINTLPDWDDLMDFSYTNPILTFTIIKPSQTLIHEYAHTLTPNQGHTAKWLKTALKLGLNKREYNKAAKRYKACRNVKFNNQKGDK